LVGANPLNAWAIAYRPGGSEVRNTDWSVRATLNADFNIRGHISNQPVVRAEGTAPDDKRRQFNFNYYEVDAPGKFISNQASLNNTDGERALMPIQWAGATPNAAGDVPTS
jgi:hypothetical protein